MNNKPKKIEIKEKTSGVEKPVGLWGAPFTEILSALLKTKPISKEGQNE